MNSLLIISSLSGSGGGMFSQYIFPICQSQYMWLHLKYVCFIVLTMYLSFTSYSTILSNDFHFHIVLFIVLFFFPYSIVSLRPPMFWINTLFLLPVLRPAYFSPSVYQSVCSSSLYSIYHSWLVPLPFLLLFSSRLSCLSYKCLLQAIFRIQKTFLWLNKTSIDGVKWL